MSLGDHTAQRLTDLREVDGRELVVLQQLRTIYDQDAAQVPLLRSVRGLVWSALWLGETDESLDEQLTRVTLLSVLRYPPKYDRGRNPRLHGSQLGRREELGGGRVGQRFPDILVEALDATVEGYGRLLVRLGRNNRVNAVAVESEGAHGETVGVAADDGVRVLLGDMTGRVFGPDQDVMCLKRVSATPALEWMLTYLPICLDKEAMEGQTRGEDLEICRWR